MQKFNIFAQLDKELQEFEKPILIAKTSKSKGYEFSQKDTLALIDFYTNSKYESGERDAEGRQKIFLNNSSFRADVAAKQIDIDVANFNFIPENTDSVYGAILMRRRFRIWAKDNYYGEEINDIVERYPKYGTVVTKKVGKTIETVPLRTLFNDPKAKSLKKARFCGEIHEDMTLHEMESFPDWDTSKLAIENFDDTVTVYERYGYAPLDWYKKEKGLKADKGDEKKSVYVMAILVREKAKGKTPGGQILFLEETDCPYEEVHWKRQDGRWLGVGVVEENFENQKARNMVENFRKNNLQWSGRKIFANTGDEVAQNLVTEVKDGQVLNLGLNGQLTQVDLATRSTAEFNAAIEAYETNADQKAFTYEVATGEAMPSGTPFRLGVVMSNSVNLFYSQKREKLGLFLKRVYIEQIMPVFKKENRKEQTILLSQSSEEYADLQDAIRTYIKNRAVIDALLRGQTVDPNLWMIDEEVDGMPAIEILIPEGYWDKLKYSVTLEITGEEIDIPKKMETLTTLYQAQVQSDPEGAQETLDLIMSLAGEKPRRRKKGMTPMPGQPVSQSKPSQPSMDEMAMMNAPEQGEL
jgi:hypothetical protein